MLHNLSATPGELQIKHFLGILFIRTHTVSPYGFMGSIYAHSCGQPILVCFSAECIQHTGLCVPWTLVCVSAWVVLMAVMVSSAKAHSCWLNRANRQWVYCLYNNYTIEGTAWGWRIYLHPWAFHSHYCTQVLFLPTSAFPKGSHINFVNNYACTCRVGDRHPFTQTLIRSSSR